MLNSKTGCLNTIVNLRVNNLKEGYVAEARLGSKDHHASTLVIHRNRARGPEIAAIRSICVQACAIMLVNQSASPQTWTKSQFCWKEQLPPPPPPPLPYMCGDSWSGRGVRGGRWSQCSAFHNCIGAYRNKEEGPQPFTSLWWGIPVSFVHPRPEHQLVSCTLYIHPPIAARPLLLFSPVTSIAASRRPTASSSTLLWSINVQIPNDTQTTFILIQASKSPYRANPETVKYSEL